MSSLDTIAHSIPNRQRDVARVHVHTTASIVYLKCLDGIAAFKALLRCSIVIVHSWISWLRDSRACRVASLSAGGAETTCRCRGVFKPRKQEIRGLA